MGQIKIRIQNINALRKQIKKLQAAGESAVRATVKDIKRRAPSWVAQEVTKTYGINRKELVPSKDNPSKKLAGKIRVKGDHIEDMVLIYKGRPLTLTHFKLKARRLKKPKDNPMERVPGERIQFDGAPSEYGMLGAPAPWDIRVSVFRGKRVQLREKSKQRSAPFMATIRSNKEGTGDGVSLPFQRKADGKLRVIKGPSVPQMIQKPEVYQRIQDRLSIEVEKRFQHQLKRFIK